MCAISVSDAVGVGSVPEQLAVSEARKRSARMLFPHGKLATARYELRADYLRTVTLLDSRPREDCRRFGREVMARNLFEIVAFLQQAEGVSSSVPA
jgi:hypothetical protein